VRDRWRRAAIGAIAVSGLCAFAWLLVQSLASSSAVELQAACAVVEHGASVDELLGIMPPEHYRPGCCDAERDDCTGRLPCRRLSTSVGELLYNCDEEGTICPFLWRYEAAQCSVLLDLNLERVIDTRYSELPI